MNTDKITENQSIVLFDGDCGFCNFWVQWIIKNDHHHYFLFTSLQSDFGQQFLKERRRNTLILDTIYLWKPHHYYLEKSDAIIEISQHLDGISRLLILGKIFPKFIRNWLYDIVAKHRKRIKINACELPSEAQKARFIY